MSQPNNNPPTNNSTMAPTPSSTGSSHTAHQSPENQHRVVRRRNRVPLSCAPCRHRKLKCNRAHPCDNCQKRCDTASCTYAAPGNRRRTMGDGNPTTPDEMQNRIDRLEGLVLSLISTGQPGAAQAAQAAIGASRGGGSIDSGEMDQDHEQVDGVKEDSEVERVSNSIGIMKVQNDRNIYASEGHWYAILSDIAEVKSWFADHKKQYDEQARKISAWKGATAGSSMLFKGTAKMDHRDLLANFPPRHIAEVLITRYFETENPATHIIHRPTYCKQYEKHWANPHMTTTAWLGMTFAMMTLALQSYHRAGDEPREFKGRAWENSLNYLELTTQALVVADFTQPIVYMVETLCLYLQAESARTHDAETGVWILVGIVARLAMRIGLHRDPKPFETLSPFQGEMRRRLWNFVRSADILMSYQCGMPSLIKSADCDTALPTNIFDEEFDEDTKVLSPSRPLTEATPMSFMIVSCHMTFVLGKILEASSALTPLSYEVAMKLDNDLREVRTHIPPNLSLKTREESALDPAPVIMQRYTLDLIYQKSQVALHRKFLNKARENVRFAYSRRTCVEACLQMLKHQLHLHTESQPGGRLHNIPWSYTSAVSQSDFLLAAMVVCLDLYHTAAAEARGQNEGEMYEWAVSHRDEMSSAIERAVGIWESLRDQSMEAFKASSVLKVMLEKLKNHAALHQALGKNFSFAQQPQNGMAMDAGAVAAPEHSAAMTLGMMSSGMTPDAMMLLGPGGFQNQRTGMTPQPMSGSEMQQAQQAQNGQAGGGQAPMAQMGAEGLTPFTNMLGGFSGGDLANGVGASLDWDAWDNFVAGTQMDTSNAGAGTGATPNFNIDPVFSTADPVAAAQQAEQAQRQQQQQQQSQQNPQQGNGLENKADIKNPFPSLTQLFAPGGEAYNTQQQQQGANGTRGN